MRNEILNAAVEKLALQQQKEIAYEQTYAKGIDPEHIASLLSIVYRQVQLDPENFALKQAYERTRIEPTGDKSGNLEDFTDEIEKDTVRRSEEAIESMKSEGKK